MAASLFAVNSEPVPAQVTAQVAAGTIRGHVRLKGPAPANAIIRMGADPRCAAAARAQGERPVQQFVLRAADGGLANAFVDVQGSFPSTPVPTVPVQINQQGCIFTSRVVGARAGQTLQVRNGDMTVHNVHSLSSKGNDFNTSQPVTGMTSRFALRNAEMMLRLKCDIHSWMVAYVGIVAHPHFAVSDATGLFQIPNVPAGTYTIRAWHEQYGPATQKVQVKAGAVATVEFGFEGTEKPAAASVRDLVLPAGLSTIQVAAAE
jgi:hypothetical protein